MNDKNEQMSNQFLLPLVDESHGFIPVIPENIDDPIKDADIPEILPILPLRNTVLYPFVFLPISVGRESSVELIKTIYEENKIIGIVAQRDSFIDKPSMEDLYEIGTLAKIYKIIKMPDDSISVIIRGERRIKINKIVNDEPYLQAEFQTLNDVLPPEDDKEFEAVVSSIKDMSIKIIQLSINIPNEITIAIKNIDNISFLINFICTNTDFPTTDKQNLLEITDYKERIKLLMELLAKEVHKLELKDDIQTKVKTEIEQEQREYFLNQQIKTIQDELGANPADNEIKDLKTKAKGKKWNKETEKVFKKELDRLKKTNPTSPDYSNQLTYLQILLELPWNEYTKDNFNLKRAEKILNKEHFGLDNIKDRILQHLAVLKLKGDLKSPILCLYGPPGVGKTSLGKSIAEALDRKYARMSLGGLHDEAEIRGHRKTYIGALPGRIIQNLKKVKSSNPVFVLDEIDKVGNDFRGDPSFALLEVLDPEQNNSFYDNYLELEYDLSKVMFIATANSLSPIKPALRDRMEMINVTGYIVEEKIEIAKRHLIPKQLLDHGVEKKQLSFSKKVIEDIIINYTRESGVRQLDKKLAEIIRKIAKMIAFDEKFNKKLKINDISKLLGVAQFISEKYQGNEYAGVVTGLAWTAMGGQILFVETSLSKGNGKLTLTGNLGEVMKESAILALEYIKAHASLLNLNDDVFNSWNVHIHVPEGAIPKDGPSAGVTMATSIASAFTQRKLKRNLAMTGEITLRGKVMPVGGIKEKILAAKRADIKEIILPKDNEKDIIDIKDIYIKGLKFHYVDKIDEVLNIAISKYKIDNPLKIK